MHPFILLSHFEDDNSKCSGIAFNACPHYRVAIPVCVPTLFGYSCSMTHRKNSWDEWEDETENFDTVEHSSPMSSDISPKENYEAHEHSANEEFAGWTWDTEAIQNELDTLLQSSNRADKKEISSAFGQAERDTASDYVRSIMLMEATTLTDLQHIREDLYAWRYLSLVLNWHLLQMDECINKKDESRRHKFTLLESELHDFLSTSTLPNDMDEDILSRHRELQEALSTNNLVAYSDILKKIFDHKTLKMSHEWSDREKQVGNEKHESGELSYLEKIDLLPRINGQFDQLTESERFQDSKDIQRDSIRINGQIALGTQGYDAIVDQIQCVIKRLIEITSPILPESMEANTTLMAREILHACNRTESGGFSFEMLSSFLTNHTTKHVLCRPDSSKAEPLSVEIKLGGFRSHMEEENLLKQCSFGVHVMCSALTRYSICRSDDPTCTLHSLAATYKRELLFPCKLTPFCKEDVFAQSVASVELELFHTSSGSSAG
uniref:Uncharacterized protein AlNc14C155G7626 n=1 Tax=Albugo laibachii Nc14 TaxID=890382 RepID=F0WMC1_9STRA|nr:conserved hypothetical protein [Albugo laibachii Nc14]|eukprot:CCA22452.1 conserved hypothetical protein [Albugo laibachii Nc14]